MIVIKVTIEIELVWLPRRNRALEKVLFGLLVKVERVGGRYICSGGRISENEGFRRVGTKSEGGHGVPGDPLE